MHLRPLLFWGIKQLVLGRPMGPIARNNALHTDGLYRNLAKKLLS